MCPRAAACRPQASPASALSQSGESQRLVPPPLTHRRFPQCNVGARSQGRWDGDPDTQNGGWGGVSRSRAALRLREQTARQIPIIILIAHT